MKTKNDTPLLLLILNFTKNMIVNKDYEVFMNNSIHKINILPSSVVINYIANKNKKPKTFLIGKNYIAHEKLGKGTYGSVYKAQKKDTNEFFAIKKIKLDVDTEGIPSTALREIAILKKMKYPNIVRLKKILINFFLESKKSVLAIRKLSSA